MFDISFRFPSQSENSLGFLYLHTSQGVSTFKIKSKPETLIKEFKKTRSGNKISIRSLKLPLFAKPCFPILYSNMGISEREGFRLLTQHKRSSLPLRFAYLIFLSSLNKAALESIDLPLQTTIPSQLFAYLILLFFLNELFRLNK